MTASFDFKREMMLKMTTTLSAQLLMMMILAGIGHISSKQRRHLKNVSHFVTATVTVNHKSIVKVKVDDRRESKVN